VVLYVGVILVAVLLALGFMYGPAWVSRRLINLNFEGQKPREAAWAPDLRSFFASMCSHVIYNLSLAGNCCSRYIR
jgi:uncharacterized protein YneF (UPF0154 family)